MGLNEEVAAAAGAAKGQAEGGGAPPEMPLVEAADKTIITAAPEGEAAPEAAAAPEPVAEAKITIGGKDFETKEEAWAYAESLQQKVETESLANDMYRQGLQDAARATAQPEKVTDGEPKEEENFEEEFYSDPQAYLRKQREQVLAEADARYAAKVAEEREANENAKKAKALWTEFYEGNQDLQGKDTLVQAILNKNWTEYETLTPKLAMAKLSTAVRAELRVYGLEAAPQTDLGNLRGAVSTGGDPNVTTKKTEEKAMDFISQINQHQDKGINS